MRKRPLTLLFDAHPLLGEKTGVGYYTEQLVTSLAKNYPHELRLIGYYHNFLLRKRATNLPAAANISYRRIAFIPGQLVNLLRRYHVYLPLELLTFRRPDFTLYPNFWGPPSLFRVPYAPVVHDLTFKDHPEHGSKKNMEDLRRYMPKVIKRSSFVITVSDFSKKRIIDDFNVSPQKVLITHIPPQPPLEISQERMHTILNKRNITKPYVLFIGTLEPRKNLPNLIKAYSLLPDKLRDNFSLVIAGKTDWKYEGTVDAIRQAKQAGNDINYLGYVDDTTRGVLYKNARLFVLPAYYEGFGMQILEALSYGVPCAVSDIPVFREVASGLARYFDPDDPNSIAAALEMELKNVRKADGDEMSAYLTKNFNWDTICKSLLARIREAVSD